MGFGSRRRWAILLVGLPAAAAASDFAQWSLWRRSLQHYADAAASDGAKALLAGQPVRARALTEVPDRLELAEPPVVEAPPSAGAYRGRPNAVRVRLTARRIPWFASHLFEPRPIVAEATTAVLPDGRGGWWVTRVE